MDAETSQHIPNTDKPCDVKDIKRQMVRTIFRKSFRDAHYYPSIGFTHTDLFVWRDINHAHAHIFFDILNAANIEYYVFAGTSVGYVRNGRSVPWVDDYDVLVLETQTYVIEQTVCAALTAQGFTTKKRDGGVQIFSGLGKRYFQCDIFYSRVNENGLIKNIAKWGRYTRRDVPWTLVSPAQRVTVDGDLNIPLFADYARDVAIEYGDVIHECVLHIKHSAALTLNAYYEDVYRAFDEIKNQTIRRTHKVYAGHVRAAHITLPPCTFENPRDLLTHLHAQRAHTVWFFDPAYLKFCPDIAMYFPDVAMRFCMCEPVPPMYNCFVPYVTQILYTRAHDADMLAAAVPRMPDTAPARAVTFGTFDLLHSGHLRNLARMRLYGAHVTVGVADASHTINTTTQRAMSVAASGLADDVYIKDTNADRTACAAQCGATVLVAFDVRHTDFTGAQCACVYVPRQPPGTSEAHHPDSPEDRRNIFYLGQTDSTRER